MKSLHSLRGTLLAATALGSVLAASIGVPQAQAHRFNRLESLLRETVAEPSAEFALFCDVLGIPVKTLSQ
jgi:hypothetical protein